MERKCIFHNWRLLFFLETRTCNLCSEMELGRMIDGLIFLHMSSDMVHIVLLYYITISLA